MKGSVPDGCLHHISRDKGASKQIIWRCILVCVSAEVGMLGKHSGYPFSRLLLSFAWHKSWVGRVGIRVSVRVIQSRKVCISVIDDIFLPSISTIFL
jgi:hypothetical protein